MLSIYYLTVTEEVNIKMVFFEAVKISDRIFTILSPLLYLSRIFGLSPYKIQRENDAKNAYRLILSIPILVQNYLFGGGLSKL